MRTHESGRSCQRSQDQTGRTLDPVRNIWLKSCKPSRHGRHNNATTSEWWSAHKNMRWQVKTPSEGIKIQGCTGRWEATPPNNETVRSSTMPPGTHTQARWMCNKQLMQASTRPCCQPSTLRLGAAWGHARRLLRHSWQTHVKVRLANAYQEENATNLWNTNWNSQQPIKTKYVW